VIQSVTYNPIISSAVTVSNLNIDGGSLTVTDTGSLSVTTGFSIGNNGSLTTDVFIDFTALDLAVNSNAYFYDAGAVSTGYVAFNNVTVGSGGYIYANCGYGEDTRFTTNTLTINDGGTFEIGPDGVDLSAGAITINDTGELWVVPGSDVRVSSSWTDNNPDGGVIFTGEGTYPWTLVFVGTGTMSFGGANTEQYLYNLIVEQGELNVGTSNNPVTILADSVGNEAFYVWPGATANIYGNVDPSAWEAGLGYPGAFHFGTVNVEGTVNLLNGVYAAGWCGITVAAGGVLNGSEGSWLDTDGSGYSQPGTFTVDGQASFTGGCEIYVYDNINVYGLEVGSGASFTISDSFLEIESGYLSLYGGSFTATNVTGFSGNPAYVINGLWVGGGTFSWTGGELLVDGDGLWVDVGSATFSSTDVTFSGSVNVLDYLAINGTYMVASGMGFAVGNFGGGFVGAKPSPRGGGVRETLGASPRVYLTDSTLQVTKLGVAGEMWATNSVISASMAVGIGSLGPLKPDAQVPGPRMFGETGMFLSQSGGTVYCPDFGSAPDGELYVAGGGTLSVSNAFSSDGPVTFDGATLEFFDNVGSQLAEVYGPFAALNGSTIATSSWIASGGTSSAYPFSFSANSPQFHFLDSTFGGAGAGGMNIFVGSDADIRLSNASFCLVPSGGRHLAFYSVQGAPYAGVFDGCYFDGSPGGGGYSVLLTNDGTAPAVVAFPNAWGDGVGSSSTGGIGTTSVIWLFPPASVSTPQTGGTTAAAYQMKSAPYLYNYEVLGQLEGILGTYNTTQWRAFVWDGYSQSYLELPYANALGRCASRGMFLITRDSANINLSGASVDDLPYVEFDLYPGWNMISNPFNPIDPLDYAQWWNVSILQGGAWVEMWEPASIDTIYSVTGSNSALFEMSGGSYTYSEESDFVLEPGSSYWIKNVTPDVVRGRISNPLFAAKPGFKPGVAGGARLSAPIPAGAEAPPAAPGSQTTSGGSGGGGGGGGGGCFIGTDARQSRGFAVQAEFIIAGLVMVVMFALGSGRRARSRR
jgi:hypothetical protein